jgi:GntR family negative regulator for fad regulon and positive regulator of fabA
MKNWETPQKPAELAESRLITAILDDQFPIGSKLPPERELARLLGVTRPTLREALQRLVKDGWIDVHQGRSTRVRDYWKEGNLGVLSAISRHPEHAPPDFVPNLLAVRGLMAPVYARLAIEHGPGEVVEFLKKIQLDEEDPDSFSLTDWTLHHRLTVLSGNPIFTLILNGFEDLYKSMAGIYFELDESRAHSQDFYDGLLLTAEEKDPDAAEKLTRKIMSESLKLWQKARENAEGKGIKG